MCGRGSRGPDTELISRTATVSVGRQTAITWMFWMRGLSISAPPPCGMCLPSDALVSSSAADLSWVWVEIRVNEERQESRGFEEEMKHLKTSLFWVQMFVKLREMNKDRSWIFPSLWTPPRFLQNLHPHPPISRFPLGLPEVMWWLLELRTSSGWGRQETRHNKHFKKHLTMWSSVCNMSWGYLNKMWKPVLMTLWAVQHSISFSFPRRQRVGPANKL